MVSNLITPCPGITLFLTMMIKFILLIVILILTPTYKVFFKKSSRILKKGGNYRELIFVERSPTTV